MLEIRNVRKSFATAEGRLEVLQGVDLELGAGETLALTGDSGSGKSTLLHSIAALEQVDSGTITVGGKVVTALTDHHAAAFRCKHIGIVFQQFSLVPSLTVDQNMRLQARLSERHDATWIDRLAQALGLSELRSRYPEQLSGGQQQRAAIARALALRPDLVLADEPTGNLDTETGDRVMALFLDLVQETQCAFVMVTHNPRLAALLQYSVRLSAGRLACT